MHAEREYKLSALVDLFGRIIEIDKALRKEFRLIEVEVDSKVDNIYSIYTDKDDFKFDSAKEFVEAAKTITGPRLVFFCTAFSTRLGSQDVSGLKDIRSVHILASRQQDEWSLYVNIGTTKEPSFANKAFPIIERALGVGSPNRPIEGLKSRAHLRLIK